MAIPEKLTQEQFLEKILLQWDKDHDPTKRLCGFLFCKECPHEIKCMGEKYPVTFAFDIAAKSINKERIKTWQDLQ